MFNLNNRKSGIFGNSNNPFGKDGFGGERVWSPYAEIRETDDKFIVSLDIPGVSRREVKVEINDNDLIITGKRTFEVPTDDNEIYRSEKPYGSFKRTFTLPPSVDKEKLMASYRDGVFNVEFKKDTADSNRKIPDK